MDFLELEAIEGLRWTWNSWPTTKSDCESLVVPLSIMYTPLMRFSELPTIPYDPLICSRCAAVLNPYARVDYRSRIWACPFCFHKNPFPRSYAGITETNLPAELFPTYSAVEYSPPTDGVAPWSAPGPAFVFVVDASMAEEELRALRSEVLLVVEQLPESSLVGLVTFDSMVRVYDLGFSDCSRVVVFHGDRELPPQQVQLNLIRLLGTLVMFVWLPQFLESASASMKIVVVRFVDVDADAVLTQIFSAIDARTQTQYRRQ